MNLSVLIMLSDKGCALDCFDNGDIHRTKNETYVTDRYNHTVTHTVDNINISMENMKPCKITNDKIDQIIGWLEMFKKVNHDDNVNKGE